MRENSLSFLNFVDPQLVSVKAAFVPTACIWFKFFEQTTDFHKFARPTESSGQIWH